MSAALDHIVINTRFEMDRGQEIFARLGFNLTPRGHHTLGSINHLMMFGSDYLELLGIAEIDAGKRTDISRAPPGLNGLVFKTSDADETFARLEALGMAGDPPRSFSRPLKLNDGTSGEAKFRTVTLRRDAFPAGRLYFCEHLTPELIWRAEWQTHPNGVTGFCELVIVSDASEETAARLATLLETSATDTRRGTWSIALDSGFRLSFETRDAYAVRFGALARADAGREAFLGALCLRAQDQDVLRGFLETDQEQVSLSHNENGPVVVISAFDTLLCFER